MYWSKLYWSNCIASQTLRVPAERAQRAKSRDPGAKDCRVRSALGPGSRCARPGHARLCASALQHLHRDIGRVGDDVIHRRALLRLRHQCLDILALGIGIDLESHVDAAEAVADIAVDAE